MKLLNTLSSLCLIVLLIFAYTSKTNASKYYKFSSSFSGDTINNNPPFILQQPVDSVLCEGDGVTFSINSLGTGSYSFQWYKTDGILQTEINCADHSSITFNSLTAANSGGYYCVVSNEYWSVSSDTASLTVNTIPLIIQQLADTAICIGSDITFNLTATGASFFSYQWLKNDTIVSGATNSTYTILNSTTSDKGQYTCSVTNTCGNVSSNIAVLSVHTAPAIILQPTVSMVSTDSTITYTVSASGTRPFNYQWYKSDTLLLAAIDSIYIINHPDASDNGIYKCAVSNLCGTVLSDSSLLTVNVKPKIIIHPKGESTCAGLSKTFTITATGATPLSYQWYKDNDIIGNATNSTFNVQNSILSDEGEYTCSVTNICGNVTSNIASLTIHTSPAITLQPSASMVSTDSSITYTVAASGTKPFNFQWYKNDTLLLAAIDSIYIINHPDASDNGIYKCAVSNLCGTVLSDSSLLTVNVKPIVIIQPKGDTICAGLSKTFTVTATGASPLSYQWYKDNDIIGNATNSTFNVQNSILSDEGEYTCSITNICGNVTSNIASLTIHTSPAITLQPSASMVSTDSSITYTVAASGTKPFNFQWYKNDTILIAAIDSILIINHPDASDNGIYKCAVSNLCGTVLSDSSLLSVNVKPLVIIQPKGDTICAGLSKTFTVNATGATPLSYQWRKGSSNISGASQSSYFISQSSKNDTGYYKCVISNACGSIISDSALLMVNTPPDITASPVDATVDPGDNTSFSITATGSDLSYQWQVSYHGTNAYTNIITEGSSPVYSNFTNLELYLTGVIYNNSTSKFRCFVFGSCGSAISDTATLTVTPTDTAGIWTGVTSDDWNTGSNWLDGFVPGSTINTFISSSAENQPLIHTDSTGLCKNITIHQGANLSVEGTFIASGDFLIESNSSGTGAFTQTDDASVTISGNATVQRYIQYLGNHYISSPLSGVKCDSIAGFTLSSYNTGFYYNADDPPPSNEYPNLWKIDENHSHNVTSDSNAWYAPNSTNIMQNMEGYVAKIPSANTTISVTKPGSYLNAGNYSFTISKESSSTDTYHNNTYLNIYGQTDPNGTLCGSGPTNGWHLVGNPYPSPLDWNAVVDGGSVGGTIGYGIQFFKPTSQYAGIYGLYFYNGTLTYTSGAFAPSRYIPSMQSFFIQNNTVGNPQLSFKNEYRNVNTAPDNYYNIAYNPNQPPSIVLFGYKNNYDTLPDKALILFNMDTSSIKSSKCMNTDSVVPNLYVLKGEEKFSLKSYTKLQNDLIIPLGFKVNSNGQYTIYGGEINNIPDTIHVYLVDTKYNFSQDLNLNPYYTFSFDTTNADNRFYLKFDTIHAESRHLDNQSKIINSKSEIKVPEVNLYPNPNDGSFTLEVKLPDDGSVAIEIYNVLVQKVLSQTLTTQKGDNKLNLNLNVPGKGIYFINIKTAQKDFNRKIIVK